MKKAFFIVAVVCGATVARGQGGSLEFPAGARNASLMNANIAEASDISTMFENPAPLAFIENPSLMLNHSQGSSLSGMQENVAFPLLVHAPVVMALAVDALHLGYVGNSPNTTRWLEYGYDLAVAGTVTSTVSVGALGSVQREAVGWDSQSWGTYYSIGADYAPTPDISYAIVFHGTGRAPLYSPIGSGAGILMGIPGNRLEIGGTMIFPSSASLRSPIVLLSFANEKVFGVKGLYYKGGIELRPWDFLSLRFGYLAGPLLYSDSYGAGITLNAFSLQYAVCPLHNTNILLQQFSISFGI